MERRRRCKQTVSLRENLKITALEFDLLDLLMRSAGRIVSRDEIAAAIYRREATAYERSLDVHINHLRRKLKRGIQTPIHTIRGSGYRFVPNPDEIPEEGS
jgi:two-component system response regulator CpxR